jgi:hypothetical protein
MQCQVENPMAPKLTIACQMKEHAKNREMTLFDLHTVGFWVLEKRNDDGRNLQDYECGILGVWQFKWRPG